MYSCDTIFKESLPAGTVLQTPRPLSKDNSCFWFCMNASRVTLQYRCMLFKMQTLKHYEFLYFLFSLYSVS